MAKAVKSSELLIDTPNEVGILANMSDALASSGINLLHLCAYAKGDAALFIIITNDNKKAVTLLSDMGYKVATREVVIVEFDNKLGSLAPVARKLSDRGIDIQYIFGTSGEGEKIFGVISTDDNDTAVQLINEK